MKSNKIMGREPAVFFALVAGLILAVIQLLNVSDPVAGALNAAVLATAGLATAALVDTDKVLPALVGLVQATFAVFLAYGSPVAEHTQAGILALIAAAAAFFVRQNVDAPVHVDGLLPSRRLNNAYQSGYDHGHDDALRQNTSPPPSGQHADGPDFSGEIAANRGGENL
jgi:hypothetical protein